MFRLLNLQYAVNWFLAKSLYSIFNHNINKVPVFAGAPKTYLSEATGICAGEEYEIGCGYGEGDRVMNVTKLSISMNSEYYASGCATDICNVIIGGK